MQPLLRDIEHALKTLRQRPAGVAFVLLTLSVGVGLNSILFTLFHVFFFAPLPGMRQDPHLVWLNVEQNGSQSAASYAEYRDIAAATGAMVASTTAFTQATASLGDGRQSRPTAAVFVTPSYFAVFGVRASAGRLLVAEDDIAPRTGGAAVAVISERLARRRFGSEREAVGRTVMIDSVKAVIVGVVAGGFGGPIFGVPTDIWMPLSLYGAVETDLGDVLGNARADVLQLAALARPSSSSAAIEANATRALQSLLANPQRAQRRVRVSPVTGGIQDTGHGLAISLAVVGVLLSGLVLLVIAANVGGLILAWSLNRRREFAIRAALGATRPRLVRQLLTETAIFWLIAGCIGFGLAWAAAVVTRATVEIPPNVVLAPNVSVGVGTMVLALVTGLLFGLAPAVSATGMHVSSVLQDESLVSTHRTWWRGALIAGQLAASLILLSITGQLLRSVANATGVDPGFEPSNRVLALSFDLRAAGVPRAEQSALFEALLARVTQSPDVVAAAVATALPLGPTTVSVRVRPTAGAIAPVSVAFNGVSPGYFRAMGTPLIRGRDFTSADRPGAPRTVVVNETMARRFWPGKDAIGQRLSFEGDNGASRALEVIGVARDGKYVALTEGPTPFMYLPIVQEGPGGGGAVLIIRTSARADLRAESFRSQLVMLDPRLASTAQSETLADYLSGQLAPRRRGAIVIAAFGMFSLFLASLGVYGATAQFVARRTREIGIRVALGATARHVRGLVLLEGFRLGGLGLLVGGVGALLITRVLGASPLGVSKWDPSTLFLTCGCMLTCVATASLLAARQAIRIDPAVALRAQ